MKKILTAVLMMMLAMALFLTGAYAEEVTGDWYADVYGIVLMLTVNADNTYVLDAAGESQSGVWELDGASLYMDKGTEAEGVFTYDAEAQILDMAGEMTFTRTAIEQWAPANAKAEAALEDFAGAWSAHHVDAFGAILPVEAAEIYMDASIAETNVSLILTFIEPETFEGEAVLEGGVLTLTVPAEDEFSNDMVFAVSALENGSISIATELFESPVVFYLDPVEILE